MFVCYCHIDALDTARTKHEEGFESFITQFEFYAAAFESVDIFRLSNRAGRLFVSERFVHEVRRHRLSGFRFRQLWSSDQGGVALEDGFSSTNAFLRATARPCARSARRCAT